MITIIAKYYQIYLDNVTFLLFVWEILGFELRALNLPSKNVTTWAMPSALFDLLIFGESLAPFAQAGLRPQSSYLCLPIHLRSQAWDTTLILFVEMGGEEGSLTFCPGCPQIKIFPISAFWVSGIRDMSHWTQTIFVFLELGFHYVASDLLTSCLSLLSAGITGVNDHTQPIP
jgi:hypothetical protein